MDMESKKFSRREFMEKSLHGSVGAGIGLWGSSNLLVGEKPFFTGELEKEGQYQVGILGCGNRSKSHISALNDVPAIRVGALCDLVPHKMKRRAELIEGAPEPEMYTEMEEMVQQESLDAVAIVLPNHLHKQGTVTALEAGKHVFCEKPMALTVADCNDMIAAAERAQKALQIGTQRRHSDSFKTMVQTIRESPVGDLLQSDVSTYRGDWRVPAEDEYPPGVEYWRMDQRKSGGVVYEMGAHLLDVNNWVFDSEPVAVTSIQGVNNPSLRSRESADHAGVVVRYANDALMTYGGNLYNYGPASSAYFFAVNGTVEFSGDEVSIHYGQPKGVPQKENLPEPQTKSLPERNGTLEQWKYFAQVLAGEEEPYPDGRIGRKTVQICQGSVLSAREGATVDVSELENMSEFF